MTATLLTAAADLTHSDRCDRCGAQAFFRAVLTAGELLFCAHHGREHADKLRLVAAEIHDESDRLTASPTVDAR